ncbi:MAG: TolB family protein [Acidobacteriota bacterium]
MITIVAMVFGIVPIAYAQWSLSPATAALSRSDAMVSPSGDSIVIAARTGYGNGGQIWRLNPTGGRVTRLSGRASPAFNPVFSPDGEWVAYFSTVANLGLGLLSELADLRMARLDGNEDRLIAEDLPIGHWDRISGRYYFSLPATPAFSPDGRKVALLSGTSVLVASTEGKLLRVADLSAQLRVRFNLVGWTEDGSEVLLFDSRQIQRRPPTTKNTLIAYDPESGQVRTVYSSEGMLTTADGYLGWQSQGKPVRRLPLYVRTPKWWEQVVRFDLLDIATGNVETIAEQACRVRAVLSGDGRFLVYATCLGDRRLGYRSELHLRDLVSGEDRIVATLEGRAWRLEMAPAADRWAILLSERGVPYWTTLVVDADGTVREPERDGGSWLPLGWWGNDRVLLSRGMSWGSAYLGERWAGSGQLALADVESGSVHVIYPTTTEGR